MKMSLVIRFVCIATLWVLLCIWYVGKLIETQTEITLRTLLPIIFSGIIIFVPLYKKYVKDPNRKQ